MSSPSPARETSQPGATTLSDLSGKVILVTGGNSGIGFATVQQLARQGATVYIAGRSEGRVRAAIARLHAEGLEPGKGEVRWLELDLALPSEVGRYAAVFLREETRLDVLVHNAGRLRKPYEIGEGGIEQSMLVNYVAPFMLTQALLPLMTETARRPESDVRIVVLSSGVIKSLKHSDVRFRTLEDLNKDYAGATNLLGAKADDMLRYAQTKLADTLFAKHLQRRLNADGVPITVMSVDPGYVYTEGFRRDPSHDIPVLGPVLGWIYRLTFKSSAEGARAVVYAAASREVAERRDRFEGAYLTAPGRVAGAPHPEAESVALAEELWGSTERVVGQWAR